MIFKRFALTFIVFSLCFVSHAQNGNKGKTIFAFNTGYDFVVSSGGGGYFTFQPEFGKYFSDRFYLALGSGLDTDEKFKTFAIPVFLRTEIDFSVNSSITPYVSLLGGYDFNVSGGVSYGRINPSIGVKVPLSKTVDFNLGFGYTRILFDNGGSDLLGVKAGFNFDSSGKGMAHFFKSLDYSVELGACTSVSAGEEKYKNIVGVRFNALAPLPVDNLYAGLSVGVGYTENEHTFDNGDEIHEVYKESTIFLDMMARIKYKAKQISISDKIYPFAQVDVGANALYDFAFGVNPAVGISVETSPENSIDFSVGYLRMCPNDDKYKGALRIAVGYTF